MYPQSQTAHQCLPSIYKSRVYRDAGRRLQAAQRIWPLSEATILVGLHTISNYSKLILAQIQVIGLLWTTQATNLKKNLRCTDLD